VAPDAQLMGKVVLEAGPASGSAPSCAAITRKSAWGAARTFRIFASAIPIPGYPLIIGENCTIGHRAILHGCTIGDGVLIGMGAIILNGAKIGAGALIGAGRWSPNKEIPPGALVMGAPGKVVRMLDEVGRERLLKSAEGYRRNAARFAKGLRVG
jgi:carbonic anhydrase/acetyltransferase-like protein (isoleucine patch superfamily)